MHWLPSSNLLPFPYFDPKSRCRDFYALLAVALASLSSRIFRSSTGKTGGNYFYAMEFVEEETLANHVRRSSGVQVNVQQSYFMAISVSELFMIE